MQSQSSIAISVRSIPVRNGVVALSGYGLSVRVDHGRLHIRDGIGAERREVSFTKAICGIKRLVILGHTGSITLEALKWLHDTGAGVVQIDCDGQVILASAPFGTDNSHLRRAQALAFGTDQGLAIARQLLHQKISGQAEVLRGLGREGDATAMAERVEALTGADSVAGLRLVESQAAVIYWRAWGSVSLDYARRDTAKVPEHWRAFSTRASPLTNSPRKAATPGNALLNYLYAILEAETRIALVTIGLDPGLGLLHADQPSRDSLACDVMEAIRPAVDAWLLSFINGRTFGARDFFETREGVIRITSQLTPLLAETAPLWAKAVAPVAERIAQNLYRLRKGLGEGQPKSATRAPATHLTQANRSAGREGIRRGEAMRQPQASVRLSNACRECGAVIEESERVFCSNECRARWKQDVDIPRLVNSGPAALARLRAEGRDPAHGNEAARKRSLSQRKNAARKKQWEDEHRGELIRAERFEEAILPYLESISLSRIARATGLTIQYASLIRRGLYRPHTMHYDALERLIVQQHTG